MSKKDFVTFARMIRSQRHKALLLTPTESEHEIIIVQARKAQIDSFVAELCDIFADANPNFNKAKFLQACEIE